MTPEVPSFILLQEGGTTASGYRTRMEPSVLTDLKRLRWAIRGTLDLHGTLQNEARAETKSFIKGAWENRQACVLIIHGKGLHSKDSEPVLQRTVVDVITHAPTAHYVRAFCLAPANKGGSGATLVLLTKHDVKH